jgi:hypothetical protein
LFTGIVEWAGQCPVFVVLDEDGFVEIQASVVVVVVRRNNNNIRIMAINISLRYDV